MIAGACGVGIARNDRFEFVNVLISKHFDNVSERGLEVTGVPIPIVILQNRVHSKMIGSIGEPIGNGGLSHFGFEMKGAMKTCIAQVENAGGKLLERGKHRPGIPYAYLADPDGYVIEIGN